MQTEISDSIKLTQYSHGAGCGCKISPKILDKIINHNVGNVPVFPHLLVGNAEKDDAAVMDLGDGTAIISTTDFFMPIVDDACEFGKIASTNAISDIYAMGGSPMMAIAILGWPIDKLSPEVASEVLEGARQVCTEAGIPLAGGHSIDSPEPIFGLAVTGRVNIQKMKKNGGDIKDCLLYLTKPLGVGILTTAVKKGKIKQEHRRLAPESMLQLNKIGQNLAELDYVKAMTDVTGFGLLGHLSEMCVASNVSASVVYRDVPQLDKDALAFYLSEKCIPGGTNRNFDSYGHKIDGLTDISKAILCDPQTSGGLLIAVQKERQNEFEAFIQNFDIQLKPVGYITEKKETLISVI
ncbi:MAG TPA: selenide, water dikinase SelD [Saprospiraceae bacterium]|nr:selenide, water dikinase SelD [Saprospiraceae bacterium]MCC6689782.1 selenide, water dikinase SelD [Saprospiraceae bacterium]HMW74446.1 selenide, water dikinase SelD [Saprospiraceae bacterium]HMX86695.1 selenide, water dikinase SelD [Saprospiraceae bacterium]HMZ72812.1 selenide, water dikinase SelD [Saprospiraceae bacterium]